MPKITDPDSLNLGTELVLDYSSSSARTIRLVQTGNLDADGATLQAIYSKAVELWRTDATLPKIPFPFDPITEEKMDLISNWDWFDDTTRYLIRDGGWSVRNSSGVSQEEWACIVSLGSVGSTDQGYFQDTAGAASVNFQRTGAINQAVKIYDVSPSSNTRSFRKLFFRVQGKTYTQSSLTDIGVTTLDYRRYTFALTNATDSKIVANDATVDGSTPYTGMSITYLVGTGFTAWASGVSYVTNAVVSFSGRWYRATSDHTSSNSNDPLDGGSPWTAYLGERLIGSTYYAYNVIVAGNSGTAEQIYTYVQRQLRRTTDIDSGAGTVIGNTADLLMSFTGDNLTTTTGVFIDGYQAADINRIAFTDVSGTPRSFPFTAAGTIEFSDTLVADANARYWLYFDNPSASAGDEFGTSGAIAVNNAAGSPITGNISGSAIISFTFAYDTNTQGGRTAGTDAAVVAVAIGRGTAQYVRATSTITRTTTNKIVLVAARDRVYANP